MDGQNKGIKSYLRHTQESFSMGFIIAMSQDRIYGAMGLTETTDSSVFWRFVYEIYKARCNVFKESSKNTILIMDNAAYHKSKEVQSYIKDRNITIFTIAPYWPCLNPVEKVIRWIKTKVRRQMYQGR